MFGQTELARNLVHLLKEYEPLFNANSKKNVFGELWVSLPGLLKMLVSPTWDLSAIRFLSWTRRLSQQL